MTNIFEMLKNYRDDSVEHTYGSILDHNVALRESLSRSEWMLYHQIKKSDLNRLIKSEKAKE